MTGSAALTATSRRMLHLAALGRPRAAIDFALQLTSARMPVDRFIREVLAPAQYEAGLLWQSNHWNIAQEHAVTVVIDEVPAAVGLESGTPAHRRGRVLVACVEEEQHSLPARMGVERLRSSGWDVTFLGSGLPAPDLHRFTDDLHPDAIVLSCTMPLFLGGARRCIEALADLAVPAVAAGAGFGNDPSRADRLGASGWIGPDAVADEVLDGPLDPARHGRPPDGEADELLRQIESLLDACLVELSVRLPRDAPSTGRQMARTRDDLGDILRILGLAIDLDEPGLFTDQMAWLDDVLGHRGVPRLVLDVSLGVVAAVAGRFQLPRSADLCSSTREQVCTTSP